MAYANSADPDQTAIKVQSDQGLHCFLSSKYFVAIIMWIIFFMHKNQNLGKNMA